MMLLLLLLLLMLLCKISSAGFRSSPGAAEEVASTSGGNGSRHEANMADGATDGGNAPQSKETAYKYKKTLGHATTRGQMFEVKFVMLVFLRLKNSSLISTFHLASNVGGAGAFDDVVVKYKTSKNPDQWKSCFVQLKHKETGRLGVNQFMDKNKFSLKKYLNSYIKIKKKTVARDNFLFKVEIEDCVFVLYTNAELHQDLSKRKRTYCESEVDMFLNSKQPRRYQQPTNQKSESDSGIFDLTGQCDKDLFDYLTSDEDTCSDAKDFLKALRVFSGQASEKQMDEMIKPELLKDDLIKHDVNLFYPFFLKAFETWWNDENLTLTQDNGMILNTVTLFKMNMLSSQSREQYKLDISFLQEKLFMKDQLDASPLVHIVSPTSSVKLTCTKLLQSLSNDHQYMFVSLDDLIRQKDDVMTAWRSRDYSTLVIVSESDTSHVELCNVLCKHLRGDDGKISAQKIILVSDQVDAFSLALKNGLDGLCTEVKDNFRLGQLQQGSRERINNRTIWFQEQRITLGELLAGGADLEPSVFNDDFIQKILSNAVILLGPELEGTVPYYIPRTLVRCHVLSKDVLTERDDVFLVHGITKNDLERLVLTGEQVGLVGRKDDISKCRLFVKDAKSAADTSDIYKIKDNVHELEMCSEGSLRWIKTKGDIASIKKHIDTRKPVESHPSTLLKLENRITLLEAIPGMGKSTLLTHLAAETKRLHPSTWVLRVDLSQHMALFESASCEDGTQFLESALGIDKKTPTERALFRHSMEKEGNVVGVIDGCEEIAPQYTEKCLTFLSSLRDTKLAKIIITTRHSLKLTIEKCLSTLAYALLQFTKENQRDFFIEYCKTNCKKSKASVVVQEQVVTKFLKQLDASLIKNDEEFLGVPLHAMMLAEIYQVNFHNPENKIQDRLDLLCIFKTVIDQKFHIYLRKSISGPQYVSLELLTAVYDGHKYAALALLLDDKHIQSFGQDMANEIHIANNKFLKDVNESKDKTGIVDKSLNNKAVFIHRTFAEYFAALWFSENYQKCGRCLQSFIYKEEFKVIRRFFDLILANYSQLHTSVINKDEPIVKLLLEGSDVNAPDKGGRSALHLAASFGFDCKENRPVPKHPQEEHLAELLLKQGADVDMKDKVFEWTAMEYAMQMKSWDVVDVILNHCSIKGTLVLLEEVIKRDGIEIRCEWSHAIRRHGEESSLVHQAAAYGHVNIVKLLLAPDIQQHDIIRRTFLRKFSSIIYLQDYHNSTPLHEACSHNQKLVAETLIESLGSDSAAITQYINTKDSHGYSSLHHACLEGDSELTELLLSKGADIWARDKNDRTPLMQACLENNVAAARTLIESLGTDSAAKDRYINMQNSNGSSSVHHASLEGDSELSEFQLSNGADIWARDKDDKALSMKACKKNNLAAARTLIASLGTDSAAITQYINTKNGKGCSSLHFAYKLVDSELTELLHSNGADIWARDKDKETLFMWARWMENVSAARALIASLGTDSAAITQYINMRISDGYSSLHRASVYGDSELTELLLSSGARDEYDKTPLMNTYKKNNVSAARAIISSLATDSPAITQYINMRISNGYSSLHLACVYGDSELTEFLLSNGADIWARDEDDYTPLMNACRKNNVSAARALIASLSRDSAAIPQYINMQNSNGYSSLHITCVYGGSELTELLLSNGADIWARDGDDETLLTWACWKNNVSAARALIASLVTDSAALTKYINTQNSDGYSSLHYTCEYGDSELTKLLLSNGANIWARDKNNQTPLMEACEKNNVAAARALIASLGEDSAAITQYMYMQGSYGYSSLHRACLHGDSELTELLLSNGADVWARDKDDETLLMKACRMNNVSAARTLIASLSRDLAVIPQYINTQNSNCYSSLHLACVHGDSELTELLLSYGADIWERYNDETTPLMTACWNNNVAAARALIASLGTYSAAITVYINTQESNGYSSLHFACKLGDSELTELLLSNGADIWARDKNNETPLMKACRKNNVSAARALIISRDTDSGTIIQYINKKNSYGYSSLHLSCLHGDSELTELLLSNGANIWARDKDDITPFMTACWNNNVAAARALIASLGTDSTAINRFINKQESNGYSSLHFACKLGQSELTELLLSSGADIWARNKYDETSLMKACKKNNVSAARALIASLGMDSAAITQYINTQESNGYSSLHFACKLGDSELTELLLSNGADIWARNKYDETPLMKACKKNNVAAARALIASLGTDSAAITQYINTQESNGYSSLHFAYKLGDSELTKLLLSNGADI